MEEAKDSAESDVAHNEAEVKNAQRAMTESAGKLSLSLSEAELLREQLARMTSAKGGGGFSLPEDKKTIDGLNEVSDVLLMVSDGDR
jgi:hypothetical protein